MCQSIHQRSWRDRIHCIESIITSYISHIDVVCFVLHSLELGCQVNVYRFSSHNNISIHSKLIFLFLFSSLRVFFCSIFFLFVLIQLNIITFVLRIDFYGFTNVEMFIFFSSSSSSQTSMSFEFSSPSFRNNRLFIRLTNQFVTIEKIVSRTDENQILIGNRR